MPTALHHPYCTLAEVKAECGVTSTDYDEEFRLAINQASRWLDEHCRRDFLFHDHTSTPLAVDPEWIVGNVLYLPWPVITLTEVSTVDRHGAASMLPASEYRVESSFQSPTGRIVREGRWRAPDAFSSAGLVPTRLHPLPATLRLKGTFGYAPVAGQEITAPSASLPHTVRRACVVVAAVWSGRLKKAVTTPNGAAQQVTQKSIPAEVLRALTRCINLPA